MAFEYQAGVSFQIDGGRGVLSPALTANTHIYANFGTSGRDIGN